MHRWNRHPFVVLLTVVALVAACTSASTSPLSSSPAPSGQPSSPTPSLAPSVTPSVTPSPSPAATSVPSPSPSPVPTFSTADSEIHVVVAGDTLWGIGQQYDLTVAQLLAANPQITDRSLLRPGDLVAIPPMLTPGVALPDLAIADVARTPVDAAAAKEAAAWINAFAVDLYRAMLEDGLLDPKAGAVVSPTSIAMALAMTRAGAKGETAGQIDAVLHAPGAEALARGLGSLDQVLASREGTWSKWGRSHTVALRLANGAFVQRGWTIEPSYLDRLAADFGSGVWLVDYRKDPEAARRTINAWVSSKTRGRIPELLRSIDDPTMLTLVNAVYLKAEWENWFWGTEPEPFTRPDGTKVDVPTMHRTAGGGCLSPPIAYAEGDGWRAVDLWTEAREEGKPLAMAVIVPDDLRAFEAALSSERLAGITATLDAERRTFSGGWVAPAPGDCPYDLGCYPYDVELHMPKFGVETRAPLAGVLSSLGMPDAFDASRADLSGTHVPEGAADQLYVTGLIHQANVSIDERGIEAAAATALGSGCEGPGPYQKHTLHVDRPFLFTIRDVETGAVLFMGRVVDPSTGS